MKISLITCTYNSGETLADTFDSVREQVSPPDEYIVVDGGSHDNTLEIIAENSDIVSKWISEADQGIYDAMNKGIRMAGGDIIGFLHSDDILASKTSLKLIRDTFEAEKCDAVYGDLQYVKRNDPSEVVRHWKSCSYSPGLFLRGWMPPHPTFYLKNDLYVKYGTYDTSFKISADYELMLRMMAKHKVRARYIPEVLVKMRTGGVSNVSVKNRLTANREDMLAWRKNGLKPGLFTRFLKPLSKLRQFSP
ncbi:MAG: glycosyltransferase family 2 protein [Salibacteraceae bacterium]